jgi:hypothetical protein
MAGSSGGDEVVEYEQVDAGRLRHAPGAFRVVSWERIVRVRAGAFGTRATNLHDMAGPPPNTSSRLLLLLREVYRGARDGSSFTNQGRDVGLLLKKLSNC